jgi:Polyketide cyclase / dehydrase and lipid transport
MKMALWLGLGLAGLVLLATAIGSLLPRNHLATRMGLYHQTPEALWEAITNVEAMPSWREGLKSVQKLPERNGLPAHVEVTTSGTIPMETVEMTPPYRLVVRIADAKLPFGGIWIYEIQATRDGAALRIIENGWVSNPFFRFMSKFVMGQTSTINTYLRSLAKKFGEPARIQE